MSKALVIGNGKSRAWFRSPRWVAADDVVTWGCNAIYREGPVDNLVAMDNAMKFEIHASGYPKKHQCWFSSWNVIDSMVWSIIKHDCGVPEYFIHESEDETPLCVINEYKSNTLQELVNETLTQNPHYNMDDVSEHLISKDWRYKDAGYWISYISGQNLEQIVEKKQKILAKTIIFSLGFSLVFISFGATASYFGSFLINYSDTLRIIAGIIIIIFSLQIMGVLKLNILNKEKRFYTKNYSNNLFFPFLVGTAFAFGWTPCIGPVLGSILTLAAVETSIAQGVILLSFYSLGLAIPFILSGYAITKFLSVSKNLKSKMRLISLIGGSILLITGILILTNVLQIVGFYLLEIFPFLENFG